MEEDLYFEQLNRLASILQVINFVLNVQDVSNDALMKELSHQNQDYLEDIIRSIHDIQEKQSKMEEKLDKLLSNKEEDNS